MSARTVGGCAVNKAGRAMRAWFKRWRREFNVYCLHRLEPVKLATLLQSGQRYRQHVTSAYEARFDALAKHVHASAHADPVLADLFRAFAQAEAELEWVNGKDRMLEQAELDYLRPMVWRNEEWLNQVI